MGFSKKEPLYFDVLLFLRRIIYKLELDSMFIGVFEGRSAKNGKNNAIWKHDKKNMIWKHENKKRFFKHKKISRSESGGIRIIMKKPIKAALYLKRLYTPKTAKTTYHNNYTILSVVL